MSHPITPFEQIRRMTPAGNTHATSRDFGRVLGSTDYHNLGSVIERVRHACSLVIQDADPAKKIGAVPSARPSAFRVPPMNRQANVPALAEPRPPWNPSGPPTSPTSFTRRAFLSTQTFTCGSPTPSHPFRKPNVSTQRKATAATLSSSSHANEKIAPFLRSSSATEAQTSMRTSKDDFSKSARTKLAAAQDLVTGKARHPGPATYLIHVTLECAIKVRILNSQKAESTDELRNRGGMDEATFVELFRGRRGHDLHQLAHVAGLSRLLAAKDRSDLLKSPVWQTMAGDRPYSLRYGTEVVKDSDAKAHLKLAKELIWLILGGAA